MYNRCEIDLRQCVRLIFIIVRLIFISVRLIFVNDYDLVYNVNITVDKNVLSVSMFSQFISQSIDGSIFICLSLCLTASFPPFPSLYL